MERSRNQRRAAFFDECLNSPIDASLVACEAPVGIGKTTAVTAYLIKHCVERRLRRLIIVAPYTNILTQTADVLRRALVLPDEAGREYEIVAEHHHRADFESREDRDLAVLWRAPVVLTTAVGFFEALAACHPGSLRKLHALVGSAVFIDEAHAALPVKLWPQNWRWLQELAREWSCRFVLASGSLTRFWEHKEVVGEPLRLPELLQTAGAHEVFASERRRVRYTETGDGHVLTIPELIEHVQAAPGPRLVIMNTVQSAAVVARAMRSAGTDTLHVSTALTPSDRGVILHRIKARLESGSAVDWVLVATSCLEAGVDLSFRSAFRERFSVASTIQVGGRVNRHSEYDVAGGSDVFDFAIADDGITWHPAAQVSSDVLRELIRTDALNRRKPADVVTDAMLEELTRRGGLGTNALLKSEKARNYPETEEQGRVIVADTRLVVVDAQLKRRLLEAGIHSRGRRVEVPFHDLLGGSVQIWARRIDALHLARLPGRRDLYAWDDLYEAEFLGYMAGVLRNEAFLNAGGAIV
jgi:CRISPR-associated endonuclease/helicase Cas3